MIIPGVVARGPAVAAGGEFDFSTLGTLVMDLDARVGVTVTGGGVSTWADQSGAGNDATQTTSARRPEYVGTVGSNAIAAITFDAANTERMSTALATMAAMTTILVGRQAATLPIDATRSKFGSGASSSTTAGVSLRVHNTAGAMDYRYCDGTARVILSGANVAVNTSYIAGFRHDSTNYSSRVSGGSIVSGAHGRGSPGTGLLSIGTATSASSSTVGGMLSRILVYSNHISDTNFNTAFTNLNTIYGIY